MNAADAFAPVFQSFDALNLDGPLGLAVSGGGDSVAMMHLAHEWSRTSGARLRVATVDHGLRAESVAEAQGVEAAAAKLGLPSDVLRWRDWDGRGNMQDAARRARRSLLSDWASEVGARFVALGHTMDDQAETVLMRLGRGSGVDGLSGMRERAPDRRVTWLRPLLRARREALRAFLKERGVRWIDDPSNEDVRFDRVRVRRALPALADIGVTVDGLAATSDRLAEARSALEFAARDLAEKASRWGECGDAALDLPRLRDAPPEIARRVFRATLTRVAGSDYGPRADAERDALGAALGLRLGGGRSLHGCLIRPDGPDSVRIAREAAAVSRAMPRPGALWDGRFAIAVDDLQADARIGPLGATGDRRLSALTADGALSPTAAWRNAPRAARIATPALWRDGELAAAPLAGYGTGMTARFAARDPFAATG